MPPSEAAVAAAWRAYVGATHTAPAPAVRAYVAGVLATQLKTYVQGAMARWHRDEYPGTFSTHYMSFELALSIFEFQINIGGAQRSLDSAVAGIKAVLGRMSDASARAVFRPARRPAKSAPEADRAAYTRNLAENARDYRRYQMLRPLLMRV